MKIQNKILFFLISIVILIGCDKEKPFPLEPNNSTDSSVLEIEVLGTQPNQLVPPLGYDSTGLYESLPSYANRILLNSIRYSNSNGNGNRNVEKKLEFAEVIFYDKNFPVRVNNRLVGYKTRYLGRVRFDDDTAKVVFNKIRFAKNTAFQDTVTGFKYLHNLKNQFPFNSNVSFKLERQNQLLSDINIEIPEELIGNAYLSGTPKEKNVKISLTWNGIDEDNIDVIIGGEAQGKFDFVPLVRFKTKDNGKINLPREVLEAIPFDKFRNFQITLIRKKQQIFSNDILVDNFIAAQSIHNIRVNLR